MCSTSSARKSGSGSGSSAADATTYLTAAASVELIVNPATLAVTADHQTKVYGQDDPDLTFNVGGFQFSDTAESVLSGGLARQAGENVGVTPSSRAATGVLWPANNKMIPVEILVVASDECTDPDDLEVFVTVTSSQPDDTDGNGEHINDVNGSDGYVEPVAVPLHNLGGGHYSATVHLRAERDGRDKAGRIYSITVEAVDTSDNVGHASTTVVVPHSQGKKK